MVVEKGTAGDPEERKAIAMNETQEGPGERYDPARWANEQVRQWAMRYDASLTEMVALAGGICGDELMPRHVCQMPRGHAGHHNGRRGTVWGTDEEIEEQMAWRALCELWPP